MSQPFGSFRLLTLILIVALSLTGCGEGNSSSSEGLSENESNTTSGLTDERGLPEMDGYITYDFSLRGTNDDSRVYRKNLDSGSLRLVQSGDGTGGHIFVGGIYADDLFAPAVVTAGSGGVSIHSRVGGDSIKLSDVGKGQEACSVSGFMNNDLTSGLIYLMKSGEDLSCDFTADSDDNNYWLKFENNSLDVWESDGTSAYTDVYFTAEGNIDFVAADNHDEKAIILYGASGTVLQRIEGSMRKPEIYPLATPGLTRDDTYVGVLNDDEFLATTVSMLVSSGLAGAQPLVKGLSGYARLASISLTEDDRYTIIDDRGVLHKVDGVNRTASILADFSERYEDAWMIDNVVIMGGKAIVLSSAHRDADWSIATSEAHSIDLTSGEVTLLLSADSLFRASRTESLLFVNYLDSDSHYRTMIIPANGEPSIPSQETYYSTSLNLARGGDRSKAIAMTSSTPKDEDSPTALLKPEIWEVNEQTGSVTRSVTKLIYNCQSMDSRYAIDSHMSVNSFCDDGVAFKELDLERGWLDFVTSDYRSIY